MDQTKSAPSPAQQQVIRSGLREQVNDRILTAIFERQFEPGAHLVVQRLAAMYAVSPTPVREALVELGGLGMIDLLPNRGAVVRPFGRNELRHMSQVRRVLECEATRHACGQIEPAKLSRLRRELHRVLSLKRDARRDALARAADTDLHTIIADHCGNPRLAAEIGRYLTLFRSLRNVSHLRDAWNEYRRSNDVPEHLTIVKALIARNPEQAVKAMDQHLRSIEKTIASIVFEE